MTYRDCALTFDPLMFRLEFWAYSSQDEGREDTRLQVILLRFL